MGDDQWISWSPFRAAFRAALSAGKSVGMMTFPLKTSLYGYGSIPIDTFLVGYSHPFTSYDLGFTKGTRVLTHPHIKTMVDDNGTKMKMVHDHGT